MTAIVALSDADAGHGTLMYNGYRFGALRNFRLELTPEYDEAGRALVGNRLTLTVTEVISGTAESTVGTAMLALRRQLTEPGQTLVVADVGFGDMSINGSNVTPALAKTHDDIEWGPKPEVVSLQPLGGSVSWELVWTVSAFIRDCPGTTGSGYVFAALNYRTTYGQNYEGLSQRIITGHAILAQTRVDGGRSIALTPDLLWDRLTIELPIGFRRVNKVSSINEAKTRLDFNIVDEELPGEAPPEYMVDADIDYDAESVPPGFSRWEYTLSGSLTVRPGASPSRASTAFWNIAFDKLSQLQQVVGASDHPGVVIPTKLRFGTKLFSRSSRFSIQFSVVHCLEDLLRAGGMWSPVAGSNYALWRASMADVFSNRGVAGLRQSTGNDLIVDLCGGVAQYTLGDDTRNAIYDGWEPSGLLTMDGINEKSSWFSYHNNLRPYRKETVTTATVVRQYSPYESPSAPEGTRLPDVAGYTESAESLSYGSTPIDRVLMYGKALRIGFLPTVPNLVSIGNVPVTRLEMTVDGPKPVACFFGVPVYSVRWSILYKVNGHLSNIQPPRQNLCCETSGGYSEISGGYQ